MSGYSDGVNRFFLIDGHEKGLDVHATKTQLEMIDHLIRSALTFPKRGNLLHGEEIVAMKKQIRDAVENALKHRDEDDTVKCEGKYADDQGAIRDCTQYEGCGFDKCLFRANVAGDLGQMRKCPPGCDHELNPHCQRISTFCEHANEVPMTCPCPNSCYCKSRTCRPEKQVRK